MKVGVVNEPSQCQTVMLETEDRVSSQVMLNDDSF